MKRPLACSILSLAAAAFLCMASIPAAAQDQNANSQAAEGSKKYESPHFHKGASKPTPRTADGHPDLSGMWIEKYGAVGRDVDAGKPAPAPAEAAPLRFPSDALPYQPGAAKKARELFEAANTDPLLHCLPYGEPRIWGGPHPARLIQLPGEMIVLYERDTAYRIIPTDGRPHTQDPDPSYMGESVGKWDGDTLVVDVIGLTDKSWLGTAKNSGEGSGTFHSDALHVIERYTRPDYDNLDVQITADDPKVFTHPWTYTWKMHLVPNEQMYEDVTCSNEKDLAHELPTKVTQ